MSVWKRLETNIGYRFPKVIKDILNSTGFDNEVTLLSLNQDVIKEIEKSVKENPTIVEKTIYKDIAKDFEFNLGHKTLLLSIPEFLAKHSKKKSPKKKLNSKESSGEQSIDETNTPKLAPHIEVDPETLKKDLISKIKNYEKNNKIEFSLEAIHFNKVSLLDRKYRCTVTCPVCGVQLLCIKLVSWKFSNLVKHLRAHKTNLETNSKTTSVGTSANTTSATTSHSAIDSAASLAGISTVIPEVIHRSNQSALAKIIR